MNRSWIECCTYLIIFGWRTKLTLDRLVVCFPGSFTTHMLSCLQWTKTLLQVLRWKTISRQGTGMSYREECRRAHKQERYPTNWIGSAIFTLLQSTSIQFLHEVFFSVGISEGHRIPCIGRKAVLGMSWGFFRAVECHKHLLRYLRSDV